jgi:ATP-dependent DNA helicase RecG
MTNASLRERFGIEEKNKATASRLIREALDAGMIRLVSDDVGDKPALICLIEPEFG